MLKVYNAAIVGVTALLPLYIVRFSIFGIPTNVLEVCILGVFVGGVSSAAVRTQWRSILYSLDWNVKILVPLFILSAVISTLVSPHIVTSLGVLKGWVLVPILLGWMVFAAVQQDERRIGYVLDALAVSALTVSLIGIFQVGAMDRVRSIYDVPNSLALFLAPLFVATLWRAVTHRSFALYGVSVVMGIALLLTQSVGGVVASLGALGVSIYVFRAHVSVRARQGLLVGVLLGLLVGGVVLGGKVQYLLSANSSAAVRLQLWSASVQLLQDSPLLGVGLGVFEPAYQEALHERFAAYDAGITSQQPLLEFVFRDPHNWILSLWLNTGVLGLVSFIALVYTALISTSTWPKNKQVVFVALLVLLLFGLFDTAYWKNDLAALWWVLLGLLWRDKDRIFCVGCKLRADLSEDGPGYSGECDAEERCS